MSLEAIEKIRQLESENQERKAAAEAEARQMVTDAERAGLGLVQKARSDAAEHSKQLLQEAEKKAAARSAEIGAAAEAEAQLLRKVADKHLSEAVEFIVGRVVKH